jgi:RND family efflux transporter MFP subunit
MTHFKLKPTAIYLIAIFAMAAGTSSLFSTQSRAADEKKAAQPKPALTVTTVVPQQGQLGVKLSANGNITAWQEASIGSEAAGLRLLEVRANVGDVVKAGQVLATFAAESVMADLAQAKANLMEAEANALDAAGNAERARTLQSSGALSAQQINQYLTSELTARARVESAKAQLTVQQQHLKNTQVLAPDAGIISSRTATLGAVPGNGMELFRLIRQGRLEWRAEVTSAELGRIRAGTVATITAANGALVKGKVRMVAPTVDPQTRTALVYVDLPASPNTRGGPFAAGPSQSKLAPPGGSAVREATSVGVLLPGMYARGEFELGSTTALTVPQTAVLIRDGFSYVYVVGADNRVTQTKVQTGRRSADRVEVAGVPPDARLVASGGGFLNTGDLVRLADSSASNVPQIPAPPAKSASK